AGVLLQLGDGGERGGPEAGAAQRAAGAVQGGEHAEQLPRADAGGAERHGAAEVPPGAGAAAAGVLVRAVRRPGRGGPADRRGDVGGAGGAERGGGGGDPSAGGVAGGAARAGGPAQAAADLRRGADGHGADGPVVRAPALGGGAGRGDAGQGAGGR